jgi:hypothetical protein
MEQNSRSPDRGIRLLIAVHNFINFKTGRKIFGCTQLFDHAAKTNQSRHPWAQNLVLVGLLKLTKGLWAFLPLSRLFSLPKKAIEAQADNMKVPDKRVEMLIQIAHHFVGIPMTIIFDSWFRNKGLFKPLRTKLSASFKVLSRL